MKLVDFDQSALLPAERFFANGLESISVGTAGYSARLLEVLRELWDGQTRDGFTWEQKGQNSFHLRPSAFEYSQHFLYFLWENRVPERLQELTGRRLCLYHIQVVKTLPGPSYQDWHRDAYQYASDSIVGAFPAAVKLNFYPKFEDAEPRLKFIRGSHRCMANDARFDAMLVGKYENEIIESSNESALFFESSMLHGVVPDVNPKGSIRVMYSFALEHEYEKRFASKDHHRRLHDQYLCGRESKSDTLLENVKEYVKKRLGDGYDGNPYVNDLEAELKHDGRVDAWEDVLSHIKYIKEKKNGE